MLRLTASAPVRIDFGGGWTDVPPYSHEAGGYVCNLAISRRATAVVEAAATTAPSSIKGADAPESALPRAVLARSMHWGSTSPPARLALSSDYPLGAGLGGSSAAGVASLGALLAWHRREMSPVEVAELSRAVEVDDLGVAGGRQDHYAAVFGGALGLRFGAGDVEVMKAQISPDFADAISRRCILVYTGHSRISGTTIRGVLQGYADRDRTVCNALERMKSLAEQMFGALQRASVDELGALVGEHWIFQKSLHPGITTPDIEEIMALAAKAGAIGGKALGASGGGCVLLIAADGREREVRSAVSVKGELLDFAPSENGLTVHLID